MANANRIVTLQATCVGAADLAKVQAGIAPDVLVLWADLQDPVWHPTLTLAPTAQDTRDHAFAGASGRQDFLKRRSLTRWLVACRLGMNPDDVVIAYDGEGAPQVRSPASALFVSVASRDTLVAVALARHPVGVDLEPIAPTTPIFDVLHPAEQRMLRALPTEDRGLPFLALWTAKEAGLKAQGLGLKRDPAAIWVEAATLGEGDFVVHDVQGPIGMGAWQTLQGCLVAVVG